MDQNKPLISVIIPTYNRKKLLQRAIDSVLAQIYQPVELIVVDDGSTDGTFEYVVTHYPAVRLLRQENLGVSSARNLAIKQANGPWLAFLDSDDAWHPEKIAKQVAYLREHPNNRVCHTDERWYRHGVRVNPMQKHQKSGGNLFKRALERCIISPSSILLHQSVLEKVGLFDETLPACEDYDLWLRICAHFEVLYVNEPLTIKYAGHNDQLSKKYWGMDRFRLHAIDKLLKTNALVDEDRSAAMAMFKHKASIYLIGARKRQKLKEIAHYEQLIAEYS